MPAQVEQANCACHKVLYYHPLPLPYACCKFNLPLLYIPYTATTYDGKIILRHLFWVFCLYACSYLQVGILLPGVGDSGTANSLLYWGNLYPAPEVGQCLPCLPACLPTMPPDRPPDRTWRWLMALGILTVMPASTLGEERYATTTAFGCCFGLGPKAGRDKRGTGEGTSPTMPVCPAPPASVLPIPTNPQ